MLKNIVGVGLAGVGALLAGPALGYWSYPWINKINKINGVNKVKSSVDILPKPPNAIRVAVFNIRRATLQISGPLGDLLVDMKTTAEACRALDADVMSLAEVDRCALRTLGIDQSKVLAKALDMEEIYVPTVSGGFKHPELLGGGIHGFPVGDRGDALLTKGASVDRHQVHQLNVDLSCARSEPRSVIMRHIEIAGSTICVCSTHLGVSSLDDTRNQLREALDWISHAKKVPHLVFPGDFNLPPEDIEAVLREFPDLGIKRIANNSPTCIDGTMPDHILYSGFKLLQSQVVLTPVSDHHVLLADLTA